MPRRGTEFRWLTVEVIGEEKSQQLIEAVAQLEHMDNVKALTQLLSW